MPVRSSSLKKYTARGAKRSRRVSTATKVRYQAPTARNQKSQILANARLASRNAAMLRTHKIYTDWQLSGSFLLTSFSWSVVKLCEFTDWTSVMRQDPVVAEKSHTFVKRMQLNMRYTLNEGDFLGLNVFVVTMRKNATNIDPFSIAPVFNRDWIEPSGAQGFNIRLNSAIYKVHYARYLTLTANTLGLSPITGDTVGDPNTTWAKGQINLPMNMSVTQPALFGTDNGSWKNLGQEDLPYYHKYYLMIYPTFAGTGTVRPAITYDCLSVCINSS